MYNLLRSVKRPRQLVLPAEASLALTARALLQYTKALIPYSVRLWRPFLGAVDALPGRSWLVVNNISTCKVDPPCFSHRDMTLNDIDTCWTYCYYFWHCAQTRCNTNDPGTSFFDESSLKMLICAEKQQTFLAAPKPPRTHSGLRPLRESCRPMPGNPTAHNDLECPCFHYTIQVFQVL